MYIVFIRVSEKKKILDDLYLIERVILLENCICRL